MPFAFSGRDKAPGSEQALGAGQEKGEHRFSVLEPPVQDPLEDLAYGNPECINELPGVGMGRTR